MKRNAFRAAMAFVVLVALYLALGLLAYVMPDAAVERHVWQTLRSDDLLEDYPKAIVRYDRDCQDQYTMDNFTDALIVNQVVNLRSEGLKGIMLLPRYQEDVCQCCNLRRLMEGATDGRTIHYARYWHGSTFVARIMLAFTSFTGIRYLLYAFSTLLLLWCLVRLWRTAGRAGALAMVAALLLANVFVMQFSLQFVPVLLIALGGIVWLTYRPQAGGLLFFVLGSLTAFLDLLTVPTITIGLPLLAMVALRRDEEVRRGLLRLAVMSLWWLAGYLLTWAAKWGLATVFTGENIFADAYAQGSFWSDGGGSYIGKAMGTNIGFLHWKYVVQALVLLLALALTKPRRRGWRQAVQYLPVAALPFVYYLLMAHPAYHHAWFNYRTLVTAVAALLMAAAAMVDWRAVKDIPIFRKIIYRKPQ